MDAEKLGQLAAKARDRRAELKAEEDAQMARDFPGLEEWVAEVASTAGLKQWRAGMRPLLGEEGPATFTLSSPFVPTEPKSFPSVRERIELEGTDKRHLLLLALLYAKEQVS